MLFDRVADTHEYTDCKVNKATFRSSAGGFLELQLEVFGKNEATGTSYPSLTLGTAANDYPYTHSDLVLTMVGSARDCFSLEIIIDNSLNRRFTNSRTSTSLTPQDLIVSVNAVVPYTSDETDLYDQAQSGSAATAVYTNGNMSLTFTFGRMQVANDPANVGGKTEIQLTTNGIARRVTSTPALAVTNDSTA